jgi:sRNA-binding regulator protein Hfq
MSYDFSFFLSFTPLYIFLIYGVFFNKAVQDFDNKREPTLEVLQEPENHPTLVYTHFTT